LAEEMPEHLRVSIYLGAWCQLRSGELLELRRADIGERSLRISRGVTWVNSQPIVGPPKTDAGVRAVAIPPHIRPAIDEHVATYANRGSHGLLFPARAGIDRQIYGPTFADTFKRGAIRAGLPESLRFHHLR